MKILGFIILLAIGLISARFVSLSKNAVAPMAGLIDDNLRPCSGKPNCVCSDQQDRFFIAPLTLGRVTNADQLVKVISAMGGKVEKMDKDYIWATFTSRVFKFVDDLELRIDWGQGKAYLRSESRSGTSDLGVNRKRAIKLQQNIANEK